MITLSQDVAESVVYYASALDEIGGEKTSALLLEDDDDDKATQSVLRSLKGEKRDEVRWILGWFRGVADALGCEPIAVLRMGRINGPRLEVVAS